MSGRQKGASASAGHASGNGMVSGRAMSSEGRAADAMILIEVGEHRRLLRLYHACYAEQVDPSQLHRSARIRALESCNRFYEGGTPCR